MTTTPSTPPAIEPLLNARQAATVLNISERLLWSLTNRGDVPCVRLGRNVRYDPADLKQFITNAKRVTRGR